VSLLSTFSTSAAFYLVLEPCSEGTLAKFLSTRHAPGLLEGELRGILRSAVEAMIYLKKEGISHNDITPANLLLTNDFRVVRLIHFKQITDLDP
jgi:polo-like kinase 4